MLSLSQNTSNWPTADLYSINFDGGRGRALIAQTHEGYGG